MVLVLIAKPGSGAINSRVVEALRDTGGKAPRWLKLNDAADIELFPGMMAFGEVLRDQPIDVCLVGTQNRRKKLLLADMDSTMIHQECIDELAFAAGVGDHIKAITAKAMRGELNFEGALKERVSLLKGLDQSVINTLLRERITFMEGAKTLIATMKAHGAYRALVSGGFTAFTGPVADALGFDENHANILLIENGKLTGGVAKPILGKDAKVEVLKKICKKLKISTDDALAVGDGANDIPMLIEAGLGVALHAKPNVQAEIPNCINHGDLTALLYLQGYREDQFTVA